MAKAADAATKRPSRRRTPAKPSSSTSAKATKADAAKRKKPEGPSLHERVVDLEARLSGVENRLGIDHAAIAEGVAASNEAGAAAAALSEPATDEDEEA